MPVRSPSVAELRTILSLASRAPTGDNTQPWTFVWNGSLLEIAFDPVRAHHILDYSRSTSLIALGCLIESIAIAASQFGFSIEWDFRGFPEQEPRICTGIRFTHTAAPADPLLPAVQIRATDRRPFKGGPLPATEMKDVWDRFDRKDSTFIHLAPKSEPLVRYFLEAETLTGAHSRILKDTIKWVRFTRHEIQSTHDGMPWAGLGLSSMHYPAMRLMQKLPAIIAVANRAGLRAIQRQILKRPLTSSSGFVCISISGEENRSLIDAGRLAIRAWFRLNEMNYGVQPLTISSVLMYDQAKGIIDPESQRLFGPQFRQGEKVVREAFSIPPKLSPVWMFRTGLSNPMPESARTLRKPIDELLKVTRAD